MKWNVAMTIRVNQKKLPTQSFVFMEIRQALNRCKSVKVVDLHVVGMTKTVRDQGRRDKHRAKVLDRVKKMMKLWNEGVR